MSSAVGAFLTSCSLLVRFAEVLVFGLQRHRRGCRARCRRWSARTARPCFAGRVLLFAQHRDRRVGLGQALRGVAAVRRAAAHGREGEEERSRARQDETQPGRSPGRTTSVRRNSAGGAGVSSGGFLDFAGRHFRQGDDEGQRHHAGEGVEDGLGGHGEVVGDRWRRASPALPPALWATLSQARRALADRSRRFRPPAPWRRPSAPSESSMFDLVLQDQDRAEHGEAEAGAEVAHRLGDPGRLAVAVAWRPG